MTEIGEGAPKKFSRQIRQPGPPSIINDRGEDGSNMDRRNATAPLTPYAKEIIRLAKEAKARKKLAEAKLGTGQVNIEQPTTGGKVEPDERDGVRH